MINPTIDELVARGYSKAEIKYVISIVLGHKLSTGVYDELKNVELAFIVTYAALRNAGFESSQAAAILTVFTERLSKIVSAGKRVRLSDAILEIVDRRYVSLGAGGMIYDLAELETREELPLELPATSLAIMIPNLVARAKGEE